MVENDAATQRLNVEVANAPRHEQLSALLRSKTDKDYLSGIFFVEENTNAGDETPSINETLDAFERLLQRQSPNFYDLKPNLQRKALKAALEEFRQTEAFLERLREERKGLSPEAAAELERNRTISNTELSAKERALELDVFLSGQIQSYRSLKKAAKIGPLSNLANTTVGRNVLSPLMRHIWQPIVSANKAQKQQRGPFWKMVGLGALAVLGVVGSGGFLMGAIAVGWGWGLAMPFIGFVASAVATWKVAENVSDAYGDWKHARKVALREKATRDEEFILQNKAYRDGYTAEVKALEASASLIRIKGVNEHDFQGRAGSLDTATGRFLMSKKMFLKYNGAVDMAFNRSTGEFLVVLKNTDGRTAKQNAAMIEEIVLAATGRDVGESVVLGKPCNGLDAMKAVLEENAETVLLNNRLADLKAGLPEKMDQILTQALLNGAPRGDTKTGGVAQFLENARRAMGVWSQTPQSVRDGFDTSATTALENALRELTGKEDISLEQANPVTTAAAQIMGNVIENYDTLGKNEQKLALANLALGNVPKGYEKYANTIATAAAIEASRLGVTEQGFKKVRDSVESWKIDAQDETSNIDIFTSNVLTGLGIKVRGNSSNLEEISSQLRASATEIVNGTFHQNFSVSPAAWQVAAQREAVGGRA